MQDVVGKATGMEGAPGKGRGSTGCRGQVRAGSVGATAARELRLLDRGAVDGRTGVGRAFSAWRADLVGDLGGNPSTAQLAVIDPPLRPSSSSTRSTPGCSLSPRS